MPSIDLSGRRIVLTGGARGLGAAFARALVDAGAHLVIADVLASQGRQLVAALGAHAHFYNVDLADPDQLPGCIDQAAELLGGIDGLVNNAALTHSGGITANELSLETWDAVMAINLRAPWLLAKAAFPYLSDSRSASIVNIASDTALWGAPRLAAYVASKGGLIALSRSLAREYGHAGITVNALAPGLTECEATAYVPAERHAFYRDGRAFTRPQTPADVIGPLLFLLSDAARYITGQLIPVNGGFVLN